MDLRQLTTFRTIAQTASFSRTAETLSYAQSTVSAQIQALEEELGVALFDRLGKKVALTEAGKRLLGYAEKMLDLAEEARTALADDDALSGTLTISAPETLCTYRLPAVLSRFLKRFPQVEIIFRQEYDADLQRPLQEGLMDVAFVMLEPFEAPNLVIEPLVEEPLLLVAAPGHHLAQLPSVSFGDLQGEPMLLTEATCGYRTLFERALAAAGVRSYTPMEFHSVEAIKQCAIVGIGLALLPVVAIEQELKDGSLTPLNWVGRDFQVVTQMAYHKDKWLSPALEAFLSVTREVLSPATHIVTP